MGKASQDYQQADTLGSAARRSLPRAQMPSGETKPRPRQHFTHREK